MLPSLPRASPRKTDPSAFNYYMPTSCTHPRRSPQHSISQWINSRSGNIEGVRTRGSNTRMKRSTSSRTQDSHTFRALRVRCIPRHGEANHCADIRYPARLWSRVACWTQPPENADAGHDVVEEQRRARKERYHVPLGLVTHFRHSLQVPLPRDVKVYAARRRDSV